MKSSPALPLLCRSTPARLLRRLLSLPVLPPAIFLFGPHQSGKKHTLTHVLNQIKGPGMTSAASSCHQAAVHPRLLMEDLLAQLHGRNRAADTAFGAPMQAEHFSDMVAHFRQDAEVNKSRMVLVLHDAERLRDVDGGQLLAGFLRLQELSRANVCVVLVARIPWPKFLPPAGVPTPIPVVMEQYTREELGTLTVQALVHDKRGIVEKVKEEGFYKNYVSLILGYFINACNSLPQLLWLCRLHLTKYSEPIRKSEVDPDNVRALYRHVEKSLKHSLETLNMKEVESRQMTAALASGAEEAAVEVPTTADSKEPKEAPSAIVKPKNQRLHIELPFHSKFLLIAAYLSSYNPMKSDKRFFLKHHGKVRKTKAAMKAKERRVSSQLTGPKAFPLDRMMAIFYAIVDDQVAPSANILSQISSLVTLQLLSQVGSDDSLDSPKYKCVVGLRFITQIARQVEFEIHRYLYDFV